MTEAEILEVAGIWSGNVLTTFGLYISFTFAYLVTVFYVAHRLTTLQSIAVSGLYFFAATSTILAQIGYLQAQFTILAVAPNALDDIYLVSAGGLWIPYLGLMQLSGMLLGLYFMWDVKHPKTE